jgi:beta-lactamase regulating signal transducer with metallopeptidase domain
MPVAAGFATGASLVAIWVAANVLLSSVVAVVVFLVCGALGRRWPALQQALWALVLVRLLLPPGLAHPWGIGVLLARTGIGGTWSGPNPGEAPGDATAGVPGGLAPGVPRDGEGAIAAVVGLWVLAVGLLGIRDRKRTRAVRNLLAAATPVGGGPAARLAERWRRRLRIRRRVSLVSSDACISPFTDGVRRPVVFLPSALLRGGNRDALAAAIAHELAHVARFDVLAMRLERSVARLYFFHPVVWMASHRLHALREGMCDALATSNGLLSPRLYVRGLLDLLQLDLQGVEAPSLTLSQRRILMRLESVLANHVRSAHRSLPALLTAAAVGFFVLPLAGVRASASGAAPAANAGRALADPLPSGRVTRGFGKSVSPFGKGEELHKGVDLAAPSGTPVLAAAAGIVELAATKYAALPSAGIVIVVDHGQGRKTFYSHLSRLGVEAGQRVGRGQAIGDVGNTGVSTGPHLHFEVWENGGQVDPATVVPALADR